MLFDPMSRFTNSARGSSSKDFRAGMHIAKISRISGDDIFITIPSVNPGQVIGPCSSFTESELSTGDIVLVGFLDAKMDDVVIIGKKSP